MINILTKGSVIKIQMTNGDVCLDQRFWTLSGALNLRPHGHGVSTQPLFHLHSLTMSQLTVFINT